MEIVFNLLKLAALSIRKTELRLKRFFASLEMKRIDNRRRALRKKLSRIASKKER